MIIKALQGQPPAVPSDFGFKATYAGIGNPEVTLAVIFGGLKSAGQYDLIPSWLARQCCIWGYAGRLRSCLRAEICETSIRG